MGEATSPIPGGEDAMSESHSDISAVRAEGGSVFRPSNAPFVRAEFPFFLLIEIRIRKLGYRRSIQYWEILPLNPRSSRTVFHLWTRQS